MVKNKITLTQIHIIYNKYTFCYQKCMEALGKIKKIKNKINYKNE